jgi:hypothetical protein
MGGLMKSIPPKYGFGWELGMVLFTASLPAREIS